MWLPRQERHLLMAYDVCISRLASEGTIFKLDELAWFATYSCWVPLWRARQVKKHARHLKAARDADHGSPPGAETSGGSAGEVKPMAWLAGKEAVEVANKMLQDRH